MGFKTGLFVGVGIGYLIATRLDPDTRERIETTVTERVSQLRDDPRVKDLVGSVASVTEQMVDAAGGNAES